MSFLRVWVHLNWSTYRRQRTISPAVKEILLRHIVENARDKGIYVDRVNCVEDHIHVLISLGPDQTLSKVVQLIKGESSHWINRTGELKQKFGWQDDYYAESVSPSAVPGVRDYIKNQEEHHRRKSFDDEYREFMERNGIGMEDGGLKP